MFQRSSVYITALTCLSLYGCAGLDTRLPEIAAADVAAEKQHQETTQKLEFTPKPLKYKYMCVFSRQTRIRNSVNYQQITAINLCITCD